MKREMIKTTVVCLLLGVVVFKGSPLATAQNEQPLLIIKQPVLKITETTNPPTEVILPTQPPLLIPNVG